MAPDNEKDSNTNTKLGFGPNIDIYFQEHSIPGTYQAKPYRMTIKVPVHNYMVSKRVRDPPWIMLTKDDLQQIFYFIANELGYDLETIDFSQQMFKKLHTVTQQMITRMENQYQTTKEEIGKEDYDDYEH